MERPPFGAASLRCTLRVVADSSADHPQPFVGQVMTRPRRRRGRAGSELHIHRVSGGVEVRPVDDLEAAKREATELVRDEDVFRVDLIDTLRTSTTWSTDDARLPRSRRLSWRFRGRSA